MIPAFLPVDFCSITSYYLLPYIVYSVSKGAYLIKIAKLLDFLKNFNFFVISKCRIITFLVIEVQNRTLSD
jgi:hypothetical protein